jgi:hypothetical protein
MCGRRVCGGFCLYVLAFVSLYNVAQYIFCDVIILNIARYYLEIEDP